MHFCMHPVHRPRSFAVIFFLRLPSIILMRVFCVASHAACSMACVAKRSRWVALSFFSVCYAHTQPTVMCQNMPKSGGRGGERKNKGLLSLSRFARQQHDLIQHDLRRNRDRTSTPCLCSLAICFSRRSTCACDLFSSSVRSLFLLSNLAISSAFSAPEPKKQAQSVCVPLVPLVRIQR